MDVPSTSRNGCNSSLLPPINLATFWDFCCFTSTVLIFLYFQYSCSGHGFIFFFVIISYPTAALLVFFFPAILIWLSVFLLFLGVASLPEFLVQRVCLTTRLCSFPYLFRGFGASLYSRPPGRFPLRILAWRCFMGLIPLLSLVVWICLPLIQKA